MEAYIEYWVKPMGVIDAVLEKYTEVSEYQILFEADKPDVSNQMQQNANLKEQGDGALMTIIKGLKNLIIKIVETIKTFFAKLFMNGDERAAFDEMEQRIREIPGMEKKTITIKDYRELNKKFAEYDQQAEQAIKDIKNGKTPATELIDNIKGFIKGAVMPATMLVATGAAVKIARSNSTAARGLSELLNNETGAMKVLEDTIGKRAANKFKKEMEKDSSECILHRLRINMIGRRYKYAQDVIADTVQQISDLTHGKLTKSNVVILGSLLGNGKVRKAAAKYGGMAAKSQVKKAYNDAHHKVYTKIAGEQPSGLVNTVKDTANFFLGSSARDAKKQQQQQQTT